MNQSSSFIYMILKGTIVNHVQVIVLVWCEMGVEKQPIGAKPSGVGFWNRSCIICYWYWMHSKWWMPIGTIKLQPLVLIYASSHGGCVGGTKYIELKISIWFG